MEADSLAILCNMIALYPPGDMPPERTERAYAQRSLFDTVEQVIEARLAQRYDVVGRRAPH